MFQHHLRRILACLLLGQALVASVAVRAATSDTRRELVFVDTSLAQYEQLVAAAGDREVILLDPSGDELAQITRQMTARRDITAVHLFSHGEPGALWLGGLRIDAAVLEQRAAEISSWRTCLAAEADVLLYGCGLAAGQGQLFVGRLAELADANVAASLNATGAGRFGGDWVLEHEIGQISTSPLARTGYLHVLSVVGTQVKITAPGNSSEVWYGDRAVGAGVEFGLAELGGGVSIDVDPAASRLTITLVSTNLSDTFDLVFSGGELASFTSIAQVSATATNSSQVSAAVSNKTIAISCGDTTASNGNIVFEFVSVGSNAAPQLTAGGALAYTENGPAAEIDSTITVADADDTHLEVATVTISSGFVSGDVLGFTNQNGITGSYDSGTHILTLSGSATKENYQTALRSVTFSSTSDNPTNGGAATSRTITWVGNDGTANSTSVTSTINITAVNDAPVLNDALAALSAINEDNTTSAGDSVAAIVVDGSITDPDGSAVEAIAVTGVDNTNGVWQYSTDNGGTWNSFSGTTGAPVNFSGSARLLDGTLGGGSTHRIRFVPNANYNGSATFSFRAWDKSSGSAGDTADTSTNGGTTTFSSATDTASVTINAVNDAPIIASLNGDSITYYQSSAAAVMDVGSNATVSDIDSTDFNGGNLTVSVTVNKDATEDLLGFNTGSGIVFLSGTSAGSSVSVSGTTVGTLANAIAAGNDLVVNLNASATPVRVQSLIQAITYRNTDAANPAISTRTVAFTVNDGDGGTSVASNVSVVVTASDADGNLTAAGGVTEPVGLGTAIDTVGEAVNVFDFTISDGGTSDGLALAVSQIVVHVSGTSTDSERGKVTWRLNGPDAANVAGTYNAGADTLTFFGLGISIADGGNETYTINAYYNDNTGLTEDHTFLLSIDGDTDLTTSGTRMGSTSAVTNGTGTTIDIVATKLAFTAQPAGSVSGAALTGQPVVTAQDASGNTDVDFTETVTLTEASAGALTNNTQAAVAGVATFTNLIYTATADQQSFTLTANDQDGAGSDLPTVDANAVTSDVVATKLVFQTQPAPLTTRPGVPLNFSADPIVRAVDANDVVDTGYATAIVLSEVNGAGSVTMTADGDPDGSPATVTIAPVSGAATFTNLNLTYTNSAATANETFNLRASSGGLTTADSSQLTSLGLPALSSAAYDASTTVLTVTGINFEANAGGADVDVSKLTLTGEGGATYVLTSAGVEITNDSSFSVTLNPDDRSAVNQILNRDGTSSTGGTTYNLAAADDFITNVTAGNTADATNGITVSSVATPTITSAAYDYAANTLTLTGTGFLSRAGLGNDIDVSTLTLTGEGGATYTLSTSADVDISSGTSATITLAGGDIPQIEALLNKDGATSATTGTTYNLAAAEDWNTGADAGVNIADATTPVAVSNYASPAISSATYDASTGVLVVTGTNFVAASGATNDVDASLLTLRGGANETVTLTDTADVEVASATAFTVTLSAADKLHVNGALNKNGTESGSATTYNLEAADNWMPGSPAANDIADAAGNGITVSNTQIPAITSATYDTNTGTVAVTGTNFVHKPGAANDVDLSMLTFTGGVGGATYTLTTATEVEIASATSFTFTVSGADKTNVDALLDQLGTASSGGSTYNLAAADNWLTGADASADIADAGPNAITVAIPPSITSATYDAATGVLVVTGANLQANGGGADIDVSKLTLTGEGDTTYTLTDTADVERDSLSQFTVTLSATDRAAVNQILNKNGASSTGGTAYNLAAADDYVTAMTDGDTADDTNAITVSNVAAPAITSAAYDADTGVLTVTGTGFLRLDGANNDIDVSKLTLTGQGGATRTLISASVEITSGTTFSVTLNAADKFAVTPLLNQNGTTSVGGTTYNLAAGEDWAAGADAAVAVADEAGNGITVSNVDGTAPSVSGVTSSTANGSYNAGDAISIQVNFTENVYVLGTPQLTLETGSTDRAVDYVSGSGSSSLTFSYTVQAGDTSADLDYVGTDSLVLNSGSIRDLTGNNATLTLAAPGAANSLRANKALVIDNTAPEVSSIARQTPTTLNTAAASVTWRVTFAEAVAGVDQNDFAVTLVDGAATGTIDSVTPVSALIYDVVVNVSGQGALRLDLNATGTGIADVAGNAIATGFTAGDMYLVGVPNVFDTLGLLNHGVVTVTAAGPDKLAQRFTTAANEPLTLTTVAAAIRSITGTPNPVVTIHVDDGGAPALAVLATLEEPAALEPDALNVWTGNVLLTAGTTYWVLFATTDGSFQIAETAATTGGEGTWLASPDAADYVYCRHNGLAWSRPTEGALQIAIGATSTPTITSASTASGTYGSAFSYQIEATNSPTSFSATGLPSGLSLNAATGLISGTPMQAGGPFAVVLNGTNASGTGPDASLAITIAKAPLTVTANNRSRYVGYANPTFTLSYSGFRNSDTAASLTTAPTATTTATIASPVGTYPITPAGGVSSNYTFTYVNGTLTVSVEPPPPKQSQTITFAPLGTAVVGDVVTLTASASSGLPVSFSLVSGPATLSGSTVTCTGIGMVTVRATQAGNASYNAATPVERSFTVGLPTPTVTTPTQVPAPEPGGTATLIVPTPVPSATYQWQRNGADLANATTPTLNLPDVQPPAAGLYTYTVQTAGGATATSEPVIVGVSTEEKVAGTGDVVDTDVQHPNGNTYDQLVLEGTGATLTADPGKVTRMSFNDLSEDIVQVEFSGAGSLSLVMDDASTPAPPVNYNQPGVNYVRGHVGIVITGANETTNLTVISVGRVTAFDPTGAYDLTQPISETNDPSLNGNPLFDGHPASDYDGVANVAFVAIESANGKFGGIRTGNVEYFAANGFTGVYAPGVHFTGPINIGDIQAHDGAQPVLVVGSVSEVRITGGSLFQPNGQPVRVKGLTRVRFTEGRTSQNAIVPAQANQAVLEQDGVDITDLIVVDP